MNLTINRAKSIRGTLKLPGDKSISHRALLLNGIAHGKARVTGCSSGADVARTAQILRELGASVTPDDGVANSYLIEGIKGGKLNADSKVLYAGNSGTTMRLVSGVLAGYRAYTTIAGDSSLNSRPMARIVEPLNMMGANVVGRGGNQFAPLNFWPSQLKGLDYKMPIASAQVLSCLSLAALRATDTSTLTSPAEVRDHTYLMMQAMGADIAKNGLVTTVKPSELTALDIDVPGDPSASIFWLVLACIHPDAEITLTGVGVNQTRTEFIRVLQSMGAEITLENRRMSGSEPVADIHASSSSLSAVDIGGSSVALLIDELPALALAAAFADGVTTIRDAAELRHKECDRLSASHEWLTSCGVPCDESPDGLTITGTGELRGAVCAAYDDHRIAMVLGIAGLVASAPLTISGAEVVDISYPSFWSDLETVARYD